MAFTDGSQPTPEPAVRLGIYPSPVASDPEHAVDLARIARDAGLDVVVVQDHPYQPAFLDGVTTAAAIAAEVDGIEVWPHVAALPLRAPVVVAKEVATLDLLTQGRAGVVLSPGDFTDGIVAAGGPRLTPDQSATALAEAARVLRATWSGSGVVEVTGEHHRVEGLVAGPRPAHRTPLWTTTTRADVIADLADGWLLSMADVAPHDLAAALTDRPAREWPLRVGYLFAPTDGFLDGDDWADELAALATTHGLSLLLLATDDPDDVLALADAADAVRAAVADGVAPAPLDVPRPLRARPTDPPTENLTDRALPTDRPHAPTPPADATYTPAQQVAPADLLARHDALRAELARVHDLVDQTAAGVIDVSQARNLVNKMTMRTTAWNLGGYCEGYCRLVSNHHVDEDTTMFPHLRAAAAELGPVLDRLEEEHAVIAGVLEDLDAALVAVVAGQVRDLEGVRRELAVLTDVLLSHLAYEEAELLHPLAVHGAGVDSL